MTDRTAKIAELQQKDRMTRFVQLKLYQQQSVMPNLAAKSLLFRPTAKGRRPHFPDWQPVPVLNIQNMEMSFRNYQLDQNDLTGWLVLLQFAKNREDLIAAFSGKEFLRRMRKQGSSRDYAWLNSFIDRISGTQVRIAVSGETENGSRKFRYQGALAPQAMIEETRELYALELSKVLWSFFGIDSWSYVNMEARLALGQNQLAMAFQAFLMANQSPFWTTWETLFAMWGGNYQEMRKFKHAFQDRVFNELLKVGAIEKIIPKGKSLGIFW
ncbi:hypothetical protein [Megalodesulfovibrio paquesii]